MPEAADKAFHLSLKVQDLGRSVEFYGRLFGVAPAKMFPDYAKFEVQDPPVVLSLEPMKEGDRQGLDHLGVRLASRNLLIEATSRIAERGLKFEHLAGVECCYSRQSKIYMNDPDGHLVEVYTVEADLAESRAARGGPATESMCELKDGTYDHLLPAAFPEKIAATAHSLREINLRGTFNAALADDEAWRIVKECRRALRPGGKISTHILVADRAVQGEIPRLPEPAAHVRRVPTEGEMRSLFQEAGFVGIELKRFSHASVFGFGGAEFREYLLQASVAPNPEPGKGEQQVVYKGPFPSITDELGNTYHRGQRQAASADAVALLRSPTYQEHFVLLVAGGGC
jgi:catechol 2,3-dioxygenase-like lactoylglutathione lyase family enzyme